ncbi:MAG: DUF4097 domain-containing protein [Gammaproteobacteria bacterium]|nr:DUF4097 domain-containing protein [Gammaproteobacteria bacterium]
MRGFIVMAMFLAGFANAAWKDYSEARDLELDAGSIGELKIHAGAGSMDIKGVPGLDRITVKAMVIVPDADKDEAIKVIEKKMMLSLLDKGGRAQLDSWFEDGWFGKGSSARIDLEIKVPAGVAVSIEDSSGSIDVEDVLADLSINDGSGAIGLKNIASVSIDDGSGSIDVSMAAGDVAIVDGSGSIDVRSVQGSVTIDDGSGSIKVIDVEKDLIIVDDGSGGVSFSDVRGTVEQGS